MSLLRRWTEGRTNGRGMPARREGEERKNPLIGLQEQINRAFEQFFDEFPTPGRMAGMEPGRFHPRMDLVETAEEYRIIADVPGMTEKDIDITVSDESLTISGERAYRSEKEEEDYFRRERSYGMFRRSIPMPEHVEHDNIEAKFKNGVLTVHLPKTEQSRKSWRKIKVKSE